MAPAVIPDCFVFSERLCLYFQHVFYRISEKYNYGFLIKSVTAKRYQTIKSFTQVLL